MQSRLIDSHGSSKILVLVYYQHGWPCILRGVSYGTECALGAMCSREDSVITENKVRLTDSEFLVCLADNAIFAT